MAEVTNIDPQAYYFVTGQEWPGRLSCKNIAVPWCDVRQEDFDLSDLSYLREVVRNICPDVVVNVSHQVWIKLKVITGSLWHKCWRTRTSCKGAITGGLLRIILLIMYSTA